MFMKAFIICSIINVFQSLYLGSSFPSWITSIIFNSAITLAFLLGRNSVASRFSLSLSVLRFQFVWQSPSRSTSQLSSSWYNCCTARSWYDLPVLTRTARTVLFGHEHTSVIIPNVHFPLFQSSLIYLFIYLFVSSLFHFGKNYTIMIEITTLFTMFI